MPRHFDLLASANEPGMQFVVAQNLTGSSHDAETARKDSFNDAQILSVYWSQPDTKR